MSDATTTGSSRTVETATSGAPSAQHPLDLARRITELPESATIAMANRSRALKAEGRDIINLSLGEPDFDTPEHIGAAAKLAIDQGWTHYTPVPGYLDVREAIARKFQKDNGLPYEADQIILSTGAKQSISNAIACLVNPGDEVILPAPFWVSYQAMVQLAGGTSVVIPTDIEHGYKITPDQLRKALTPRSRVLLFSSPCNPSGSVYTERELEDLAEVARQHPSLFCISDEIYERINFSGAHASLAAMEGMFERTATVNGLSKGYAMTGWRLGYLAGPKALVKACTKYQGQFTSGTCSIAQKSIIAALEGDQGPSDSMRAAFLRRRDMVGEGLSTVRGWRTNVPQGAFYHFPDVSAWFGRRAGERLLENADDVAMYLLEEAGVALVSGVAFGSPNCIRLSYAASDSDLEQAIERIRRAGEALDWPKA
jgi:aspartate aminotransferase